MASKQNNQGLVPEPNVAKEQVVIKYSDKEEKCIADLKKLCMETVKLDVEFQRGILNMAKMFEARHNAIFDKRRQILQEFKKNNSGENVTKFWLNVLNASYTDFINKNDEDILSHLIDIRSKLYNKPPIKFVIEFHFEPNDYFTNSMLTKTYFLTCLPDPEEPLLYAGAMVYKCKGCDIDWNNQLPRDNITEDQSSFFDFFSPPELPEDTEDSDYDEINAILQNDFGLGFYFKERVIPKAVIFFTGEIVDCQSSESESESDSESEETEKNELEDYKGEESSTTDNEK